MSYLSGIARLPASRKIIIGVVTAAATAGNEWMRQRAGFALPVEVVGMLIVVAVANILGIAIEDSAKAIAEARKPADPTLPVAFTRSGESGRASYLTLFAVGLCIGVTMAAGEGALSVVSHAAGAVAKWAILCLGVALLWRLSEPDPIKNADPTPPVASARSESGRANTSGLAAFLGGCFFAVVAILASGCCGPAAKHAADEAKRAAQYAAWMESGMVPVRAGVLEPASLTHALPMLRSQVRAWEAQAYYLGSGPRPTWAPVEE